jgi:hypothetical protein
MQLRHNGKLNAFSLSGLAICPVGSPSVAFDFEDLPEICGSVTLLHDLFHLGSSHRVSLDSGRVVNVVDPNLMEDGVRFDSSREPSKVFM